jgi:hypothetical protein
MNFVISSLNRLSKSVVRCNGALEGERFTRNG